MSTLSKNKKKRKIRLVVMVVLLITAILIVAANLFLPVLIKQKINKNQLGQFSVTVKKVNLHLLQNHLHLDSIQFEDSVKQNNFTISKITIDGTKWIPLLLGKGFSSDKIIIANPQLAFNMSEKTTDTGSSGQNWNKKPNIAVKKLEVRNADATIKEKNGDLNVSGVNISLDDFSTDTTQTYRFKGFSAKSYLITADGLSLPFSKTLYSLQCKKLSFNGTGKKSKIDTIKIISNSSKYEIGSKRGVETDWFDFVFDGIRIDNFELNKLLQQQSVVASYFIINNFNGTAFRDKRLPFPKKPDTKLPMEIIDSLPLGLHIDSAMIKNANITYEERVQATDEAGKVFFTNLEAKFFQVSNIKNRITGPTKLVARANFMNKPLLKANFEMPNKKFPVQYRASGSFEAAKLEIFNRMLEENMSAEIRKGQMNSLAFDFQYNNNLSEGALVMDYSNLKIDVLKKKDDTKSELKSFFVNSIFLRNNSKADDGNYKTGEIHFERDKKKSIFNYWWKSLASGMKSIIMI